MRKIISIFLASAIAISLCPISHAADGYTDISGHWAQSAIEYWSQYDILKGYSDGSFQPDKPVTRAELSSVINRLLGYKPTSGYEYSDVKKTDWYYNDLMAMAEMRVVSEKEGGLYPNEDVTREEAFYMISKALNEYSDTAYNHLKYTDDDSISAYATNYVHAARAIGLNGYPDHSFRPKSAVTRAEIMTIMKKFIGTCISKPGTYDMSSGGGIMIMCSGVTINVLGNYYPDVFIPPSVTVDSAVTVNVGEKAGAIIKIIGTSKSVASYTTASDAAKKLSSVIFENTSEIPQRIDPNASYVTKMAIAMGSMREYIRNDKRLPTTFASESAEVSKEVLNGDSWGIDSRKALLREILLFDTGNGHNSEYLSEVKEINSYTDDELAKMAAEYSDGYMFTQMKAWDRKWGSTGIITWDLFRASNLAQWGYSAGYLSKDEALALVEYGAMQVKKNFTSWDQAYDNYLDGYSWWSRSDISKGRQREAYYAVMKKEYSDVFDDSLFTTDYKAQYSSTFSALMAEVASD